MKLFYIDLEQAESRAVGAYCYTIFGETNYLDATESGDLHTLVCSMCWEDLPWPSEFSLDTIRKYGTIPSDMLAAAKEVAEQPAYRDKSYRDLAKVLGHGSNYYGKPPTMSKHAHVDIKLVRNFQAAYFSAFPEIRRWHRWVAEQIQLRRQLITLLGRRRYFFGRPDDDKTLREAIAFLPQSFATGDYINIGILHLWRENLPIWLSSQVHDAAAGAYDERDEDWLIPTVCKILEVPMLLTSPSGETREFHIPTEAMVGWNLAYRSESNPDGLIKWKGKDERERQKPLLQDFGQILKSAPRLLR